MRQEAGAAGGTLAAVSFHSGVKAKAGRRSRRHLLIGGRTREKETAAAKRASDSSLLQLPPSSTFLPARKEKCPLHIPFTSQVLSLLRFPRPEEPPSGANYPLVLPSRLHHGGRRRLRPLRVHLQPRDGHAPTPLPAATVAVLLHRQRMHAGEMGVKVRVMLWM